MDDHRINRHMCDNTVRNMERGGHEYHRGEIQEIERLLARSENNANNVNNGNNGHCHHGGMENLCDRCEVRCKNEHGGEVFTLNVGKLAAENCDYRVSVWTGRYLQMTLMSINRGDNIGVEIHEDTDQYIRVERGCAIAMTGESADKLCNTHKLYPGDAIFILWHGHLGSVSACRERQSMNLLPGLVCLLLQVILQQSLSMKSMF